MDQSCHLSNFGKMKYQVGDDVYDDIANNSQVGVILKLASSGYIWCIQTVHYFLTHQLAIKRRYEIWSLIGGRPLRFFLHELHEFSDITRLNL